MRLALILSFIGTMLLAGCSKEESIDTLKNPQSAVKGLLQAKIDSVQWVANEAAAATRVAGLISIAGKSTDNKTLGITLVDSGVHKYTINADVFNAAVWIDSTEANPVPYTTNDVDDAVVGGEVNITSIDEGRKTMSGTFSVKVYRYDTERTITITEGVFTDLGYTTTLPPSATTDTLTVKIDGAAWKPAVVNGFKMELINQLSIVASDDQGVKSVTLIMPPGITPGTYTLDYSVGTHVGQYNPDEDPANSKLSASGTLTILEHNTGTRRIRGTFAFTGEEILNPAGKAEITDGYFSVQYQ